MVLAAGGGTSNEERFRARCEAAWADYEWRLDVTKSGSTTYYMCKVKVDGRWTPESAVKFGVD